MSYWWLSFVSDDDIALGICLVEADDFESAIAESTKHRCNPGGEIHGMASSVNDIAMQKEVDLWGLNCLVKPDQLHASGGYVTSGQIHDMNPQEREEMGKEAYSRAVDHLEKKVRGSQ